MIQSLFRTIAAMVVLEIVPEMGVPFPPGSLYDGEASRPHPQSTTALAGFGNMELPNGHGILTTTHGQKYEGMFLDGLPDGHLTWTDTNTGIKYVGEWYQGVKQGQGIMHWASGETFVGTFENDKRTLGTLQLPNAIYSGRFDGPPGQEQASAITPQLKMKDYPGARRTSITAETEEKQHKKVFMSSMLWEDGTEYVGEWVMGYRHGRGHCKFPDGSEYAGQFIRGQPNGPGRFTFPDGSFYHGNHVDGVRHGKGKLVYANGEVYEGDFFDGLKHGVGRWMSSPDAAKADVYVGQFELGVAHGRGEFTWADRGRGKSVYVGSFEEGKRHGEGTLTMQMKIKRQGGEAEWEEAVYQGQWIKGKKHGFGKLVKPDGSEYEGEWAVDKMWGTGIWRSKDGDSYEGGFRGGERHGVGKYTSVHGEVYEGQWQASVPNGQGVYKKSNGEVYTGQFENGQRTGVGKIEYVNGDVYEGDVQGGVPYGKGTLLGVDNTTFKGEFKLGRKHGPGIHITIVAGESLVVEGTWNRGSLVEDELT